MILKASVNITFEEYNRLCHSTRLLEPVTLQDKLLCELLRSIAMIRVVGEDGFISTITWQITLPQED